MEDSAVWKALADETRRGILDSLKSQPATTGELCEEFAHLDRCTVMKHLAVLEHSNLITLRRQGRHRMNFLNPVQLQKVHTRWLSSYTAQTSQKLLDFKKLAEEVAPAMPMENQTQLEVRAIKYAFDIDINAPTEKVWALLQNDSSSWFPDTYHTSPDTKGYVSERRVGGVFYEDYGNGNGKLMGLIIGYEEGKKVQIQGAVPSDVGGPATTILSMTLEVDGDGCRLKIDDSMFGVFPNELAQNREWAFRQLFGEFLKKAAEA